MLFPFLLITIFSFLNQIKAQNCQYCSYKNCQNQDECRVIFAQHFSNDISCYYILGNI